MSQHIVVVDDDRAMRRGLAFHLDQAGYRTTTAGSAEVALEIAQRDRPDLVLLDVGLPGADGFAAIHHFREEVGSPVIFVTARRRQLDEVMGLELGADDYVTKPFEIDVLLARVRAALRLRAELPAAPSSEPLRLGDLVIEPGPRRVTVGGTAVDLAPREYDLLHALAQHAGNVVRREDLLARVWGAEFAGEPQVLYVHIRWLREKIEADPREPRRLLTVHGVGYKLQPVEHDVSHPA